MHSCLDQLIGGPTDMLYQCPTRRRLPQHHLQHPGARLRAARSRRTRVGNHGPRLSGAGGRVAGLVCAPCGPCAVRRTGEGGGKGGRPTADIGTPGGRLAWGRTPAGVGPGAACLLLAALLPHWTARVCASRTAGGVGTCVHRAPACPGWGRNGIADHLAHVLCRWPPHAARAQMRCTPSCPPPTVYSCRQPHACWDKPPKLAWLTSRILLQPCWFWRSQISHFLGLILAATLAAAVFGDVVGR